MIISKHSDDPTTIYLSEIGFSPLLTSEEEVTLARLVAKGDENARKRMIESNLRLVVNIARRYINRGIDLSDLIEEGNLGLMHAVEKFDPDLGFRFSTYATWWIRQTVERAIMNQARTIRLPVYIVKEINSYWQAFHRLSKSLGREPSEEEIATELKKSLPEVHWILNVSKDVTSLDALLFEDNSERTFVENIVDESNIDPLLTLGEENVEKILEECVNKLDLKYQSVLTRRFGLHGNRRSTLDEVGEQLGLTRERVRQIQEAGLRRLQRILRERGISKDVVEE